MGTELTVNHAFTGAQLQIIQKSIAPDTNEDEFNLFIETCKLYGLNPMKRQISARVYSKNDAKKRSMAIVTQIDGFRTIAARGGDYRPDDDEPDYTYDEALKNPETNPHGIVRAKVSAFKRDQNGNWNRVVGVAYWDEFAPIEEEWKWGDKKGERIKTGKMTLGGNWSKMPRLMIAKCAEAQALRKGWPEDLSGLYEVAETDRANVNTDATATEVLNHLASEDRHKKLSGPRDGYAIIWVQDSIVEMVKGGQMVDRVEQFLANKGTGAFEIKWFQATNQEVLRRFWADNPTDALECKSRLERRLADLESAMEAAE